MTKRLRTVGLAALLIALASLGALGGYALAADPGGKDDPLVTLSFLRNTSIFRRHKLNSGRSLRLSPGAEFVLLDPVEAVDCPGIDPRRGTVINLSVGQRLAEARLSPHQHYVNAGDGDLFLKFDDQVVLLLKGEWK
jgi:hypothetical protein